MDAKMAWGILTNFFDGQDDLTDEECKAVDALNEAVAGGLLDNDEYVLYMRPQNVRDHLDGYDEYEAALEWAHDERIEQLLGGEPMYEAWHETCKRIGDELLEEYEQQLPTKEDADYERAQNSEEWQRRHGGGL